LGYVEVDDNELTGAIPEGLCAGGQFHYLTAEHNHLNGSIPAGLANCTTLRTLDLDNNQLTGDVPEALWTARQLQFLTLQSNQLTGSLPAAMSTNLKTLHIGNNQLVYVDDPEHVENSIDFGGNTCSQHACTLKI